MLSSGRKVFVLGRHFVAVALSVVVVGYSVQAEEVAITADMVEEKAPNFLIIVADDIGWSDIGAFGGEIKTPSVDALARQGVKMTDFYVAPSCAPTRSMLLTGMDHHPAGVGAQMGNVAPNLRDLDNYQGQLSSNVVTLAEALKTRGYATMMAGKWHLAKEQAQYPNNRGFDQSFVLLPGGASHFADAADLAPAEPTEYIENGHHVDQLPADFYSSTFYTNKIMEYIDAAGERPFMAYLAYTAAHDPLHVPDNWLDAYKGSYDQGPDKTRQQRMARLAQMGLVNEGYKLWESPTTPWFLPGSKKAWDERSTEDKRADARAMEIYAAMIELMDQQIGRLLDKLGREGKLDNTYVIFMSDNGSSAATGLLYPGTTREWFLRERDNSLENQGRPGSHISLPGEWTAVSNTPWKLFKGTLADGGIRSPFIVTGPGLAEDATSNQLAHVKDVMPTLLALAGIDSSSDRVYEGKLQPQGQSLLPVWQGAGSESRTLAAEFYDSRMVRRDNWKAVQMKMLVSSGNWELFDLSQDPSELNDLSEQHPEILEELMAEYEAFAEINGVVEPSELPDVSMEKFYVGECNWWCEFRFSVVNWLIN